MSSVSVFNVPQLHRALAPQRIPPGVAFFSSGVGSFPAGTAPEKNVQIPDDTLLAEKAARKALPLPEGEARAVLKQMLSIGEQYASSKGSFVGAWEKILPETVSSLRTLSREEAACLGAFAAGNGTAGLFHERDSRQTGRGLDSADASVQTALIDSQKVLLLAAELEERTAEIRSVNERCLRAERNLKVALGAGEEPPVPEAGPAGDMNGRSGPSGLDVPWRIVTDAALAFLPRGGALFTVHAGMARDLREAGMLHPLPEDRAALCPGWPESLVSGLLWTHLPAWRLVGRASPVENRPWLASEIEVLVARPQEGWIS